jgi:hypothetical protein
MAKRFSQCILGVSVLTSRASLLSNVTPPAPETFSQEELNTPRLYGISLHPEIHARYLAVMEQREELWHTTLSRD